MISPADTSLSAPSPCEQQMLPVDLPAGVEDRGALTVLSWGAGQESTALGYKLALDPEFRAKYAPGRLVIIGSDTGDEHPETLAHVEFSRDFFARHGIPFFWLTSDMGYHSDAWPSLMGFYQRTSTVGSSQFRRTCTLNLKVTPLYRFLADYISREFGLAHSTVKRDGKFHLAPVYTEFMQRFGQIRVILGFAKGEESRMKETAKFNEADNDKGGVPAYRRHSTKFVFPLITDLGWDRTATQAYIRATGLPLPPPSNCLRCHFRSPIELIWLKRRHPAKFAEWVDAEKAKIAKFAHLGDKNRFVYGKYDLVSTLAKAEEKFGQMSDEALEEYRMSHGHCIRSSY